MEVFYWAIKEKIVLLDKNEKKRDGMLAANSKKTLNEFKD